MMNNGLERTGTELLTCPFCGGDVNVFTGPINGTQMFVCPECGADVCFYGAESPREKAVAAWNARAERTCRRVLYKPTGVLVCSECGAGMSRQLDKYCYLHYCPNCGAKVVEQ